MDEMYIINCKKLWNGKKHLLYLPRKKTEIGEECFTRSIYFGIDQSLVQMWFAIDSNDPDVRGRHVCVLLSLALSIWSRLPECCSNSLPVVSLRLTAVTRHKESSISTARRRLSPACALHQNHSIKPPREGGMEDGGGRVTAGICK